MNKIEFNNVGPVFIMWFKVFTFIEMLTPFNFFKKKVFKKTINFPDKWVLFNTAFSLTSMLLIHYKMFDAVWIGLIVYAAIRIFEIVVYQVNVLLFHPYKTLVVDKRQKYKLQNPYRSIVLLGHNFIEVVFWFTAITSFYLPVDDRLLHKIMDNTIRIFTLNYEKVSSPHELVQMIFFVEVLCGMILTIISLAKFIGELPHVHLELEKKKKGMRKL